MLENVKNKLKNTNKLLLVIGACGAALLGLELLSILLLAHYKAQLFDAYAADGIFQLLDPLRRLYEGQYFGRDFNYFFGPFAALIHYPIFLLFGHNLFAASFAEWLISPTLLIVFFFLFSQILFPKRLSLQLISTWIVFKLGQWLLPGLVTPFNSILGVRDIGPIIIAYALWKLYKLDKTWHKVNILWDLIIPFLVAFALLDGTEFGVASSGAILITYFLFKKGTILKRIVYSIRLILTIGFFLLLLASIISAGHPISVLKYSFVYVPSDQFWYFGGGPGEFITNIWQIFENPTMQWDLGSLLLLVVLNVYLYIKKYSDRSQIITISFFLLCSAFSVIPIFSVFEPFLQTQPMQLYLILTGLLTISLFPYKIIYKSIKKKEVYKLIKKYSILLQVCAGLLVIGLSGYFLSTRLQDQRMLHRTHIAALSGAPIVSGSHLGTGWAATYGPELKATSGLTSKNDIWSLYTGLLDASKGTSNPSGFDYIIHAVGESNRAKYISSFESDKPQAVITLVKSYFPEESWLEDETWPFFEQLYLNYTPRAITGSAIVWRRNNDNWLSQTTKYTGQLKPSNSQLSSIKVNVPYISDSQSYRMFTVQVSYKASYAFGKLPWIGKMPRYFVSTNSLSSSEPVSLPPYDSTFTFPVMLRGDSPYMSLKFSKYSLIPGEKLQISSIKWEQTSISPSILFTVNHT